MMISEYYSSKSDNLHFFLQKLLCMRHIRFLFFWPHHVARFFGQRSNATPYQLSHSSPPPSFMISPDTRNQTLGSTTIDDHNKKGRWVNQSIIGHVVWIGTHIPTFLCTSDKKKYFLTFSMLNNF
jgi:hypothetical protein